METQNTMTAVLINFFRFLKIINVTGIKQLVLVSILFMSAINPAHTSEAVDDKVRISFGGYTVSRYGSTMSLTDENIGAGVSINPEKTFDLDSEQTVFRLDGHYRFNKEDALTYSWYSINSRGEKVLEDEIDWVDENGNPITIAVGGTVYTLLEYDIYKVGYLWSFYHTDKVELAAGAGLHISRIAVGLSASTTSSGNEALDVKTTLPLPVISFGMAYNVTPKYQWYLKSEFFSMSYDDWDGVYTDSILGMEYRAFEKYSFGLGISGNTLKLSEETSKYRFTYDNRVSGVLFYVAGNY